MKLKQYIKHLNALVEKDPSLLEVTVVSSSDAEGNCVAPLHFLPSVCTWDAVEQQFDPEGIKVLCVN